MSKKKHKNRYYNANPATADAAAEQQEEAAAVALDEEQSAAPDGQVQETPVEEADFDQPADEARVAEQVDEDTAEETSYDVALAQEEDSADVEEQPYREEVPADVEEEPEAQVPVAENVPAQNAPEASAEDTFAIGEESAEENTAEDTEEAAQSVDVAPDQDEEVETEQADEDVEALAEENVEAPVEESTEVPSEESEEAFAEESAEENAETPEEEESEASPESQEEAEARRQEEARVAAEKAEKKAAHKAKVKAWFKKHLLLVILLALGVLVAAGLATGHFVSTMHVAFIHNSDDLDKAIAAGKKKEYVIKSDVIYNGNLALDNVNVDMNRYTLEVKGDLTLKGDVYVGYKKTIWSKPITGGTVIVEGTYTQVGNVAWYSKLSAPTMGVTGDLAVDNEFSTNTLAVSGALDVSGTLTAQDVNVTGNLSVSGTVNGRVVIAADAVVEGSVSSLAGGNVVTVKGTVGSVNGAQALYLYPDSNVADFDVAHYYFVQYLEAPTVLVQSVGGTQVLLISDVSGADGYKVSVQGNDLEYDVPKAVGAANTGYSLPDLAPGDYTISVSPYSHHPDVYLSGAATTISVSYYVQLATPVVTVAPVVGEDGTHIVVRIQKVDHAASFVINVKGKDYTVDAVDGETTFDITDMAAEVGSYDVYVYAQPAKKSNYRTGEKALVTYFKRETVALGVEVVATETELLVNVAGSNAYYYLVEWQKDGVTLGSVARKASTEAVTVVIALDGIEVDTVVVTPLTRGYYEAGDAVVKSLVTAPETGNETPGEQSNE